jgi:hypothetical protein
MRDRPGGYGQQVERLDTRLLILDLQHEVPEEVESALTELTQLERWNDSPAPLEDDSSRHLCWRGYVTGGVTTVWEMLGELLLREGLSAMYTDPLVEAFVPARGESVAVLGPLRRPVRLSLEEWREQVGRAANSHDLHDAMIRLGSGGAESEIRAARAAVGADSSSRYQGRPEQIEVRAPGEVLLELVEESDVTLTESFDPDGFEEGSWASCGVLRWRTEFLAPGTARVPGQSYDDCLTWRVAQWEWAPDDEEDQGSTEGEEAAWKLRGQMPVRAPDVAEHLPDELRQWVERATRHGIERADELRDEVPGAVSVAESLRSQLAEL